ncbi:PAS domain S-box protein [Thermithiobacillus plumbiphilus]|uniref:histidine kinase n=1 Tax=Thermithiobacillus plumbiphilus TaxID=1729899 RepID=A0ABU9D677_9PROT
MESVQNAPPTVQQDVRGLLHDLVLERPSAIYSLKADGPAPSVIWISEDVYRITGYTVQEAISSPEWWSEHLHPQDRTRVLENRHRLLFDEDAITQEYRFRHKDGSYRWLRDEARLERDPAGAPQQIIGILYDITEQREAEISLREREKAFRLLFMNSPLPMWVFDLENLRFLEVNLAATQYYGYSREQFLGMRLDSLTPRENDDRFFASLASMRESAAPGSPLFFGRWRHVLASGRSIEVETFAHLLDYRGQRAALMMALDVSDRKIAQDALRDSEERFRATFNQAAVGMAHLSPDCHLLQVNQKFADMLGYSREEMLGLSLAELTHSEDLSANADCQRRLLGGEISNCVLESRYRHRHGDWLWVNIARSLVRDGEGQPAYMILVIEDISARKQAELERCAAEEEVQRMRDDLERRIEERTAELKQLNRELEAFSYSVSHDLRAPLRVINGFSLALLEDYGSKLDQEGVRHLERVRSASIRMGELIDDLLNLAQINRSGMKIELVNLSQIALRFTEDLRSSSPERQVDFVIAPDLLAQGDAHLLEIVLENLLRNAWKFTSKQAHARIELGQTRMNGEQVFFVRDNGAGFDMQYAHKLFVPFQRLHGDAEFKGTGVGLATVQRIIHRHGGRIWAQGSPNQGATFYFTLNPQA